MAPLRDDTILTRTITKSNHVTMRHAYGVHEDTHSVEISTLGSV